MRQDFLGAVRNAHESARRHRDRVEQVRKNAEKNPGLLAATIVEVVPRHLLEFQAVAMREFKLDLTEAEQIRSFAATSVAEWQLVCRLATQYQIYSACLHVIERYVEDPNLDGACFAQAVCEAFLEALERLLYTVALDFEQLKKALPGQQFANEELVKVLTGITATRTSLHINVPLRTRIDELREGSREKTIRRERFEQLLLELPAEVLGAWERAPHPLANLASIRTEAVAKLEGREKSPTKPELATFAEREAGLKRAREVGLPPREHELFELVVRDPGRFLRNGKLNHGEAARELGVAVGTTKSLWSRIKKTLGDA